VKYFFCHCCTLKSDNIVIPNEERCSKWCDPELNSNCFADNMNMEEYRFVHEQMGTILAQQMRPLAEICMRSWLNNNENPQISTEDGKKSMDSIHFEFW